MRCIKFRGIDQNGNWCYGDLFHYHKGEAYISPNNCRAWDLTHDGDFVIADSVGQYTGLKDKNGTEIYEGDIIRYEEHEGYYLESFYAKVVFDEGAFGYNCHLRGNVFMSSVFSPFCEHDCLKEDFLNYVEVVGNVYDDKEWLDV
jgi:uncharacterized phage protein (TIGR01671 family)|nr:MAG TPA: YopX protein [Caudoviricetes sp.]